MWKFGKKGTIYGCGAYNATSFVLVVVVNWREYLEEFMILQEFDLANLGFSRVRLVVPSSCIVGRFYFFGRGHTDGHTKVFCRGGPTNAWEKEGYPR